MPKATIPPKGTGNGGIRVMSTAPAAIDFSVLDSVMAGDADTVPDGWFTPADYARERGISVCTAERKIRAAVDLGIVERRLFRMQKHSRMFPVPHYRIKDVA